MKGEISMNYAQYMVAESALIASTATFNPTKEDAIELTGESPTLQRYMALLDEIVVLMERYQQLLIQDSIKLVKIRNTFTALDKTCSLGIIPFKQAVGAAE